MVAASVDVEAMAAFPLGIIGELSSQCALSLTLLVFKILEYLASDRAHRQFITPQVVIRIDITERLSMIESKNFHDVRYSYRARCAIYFSFINPQPLTAISSSCAIASASFLFQFPVSVTLLALAIVIFIGQLLSQLCFEHQRTREPF